MWVSGNPRRNQRRHLKVRRLCRIMLRRMERKILRSLLRFLRGDSNMATSAVAANWSLFTDKLYTTTDLNRRTGEVLNHAQKAPVTISRNGEQFALLRRDQAAELVRAALQFGPILQLIESALSVAEGSQPSTPFDWLREFETSDLKKLVREVLVASIAALNETNDWDAVSSIIHEWHESALVAASGVLEEVMNSPSDETPLTDPRQILEAQKELARSS